VTIDKFLAFLFNNNTTVIEVLFASVLVLLVLLALRLFLSSKEPKESGVSSGSLSELEASLKKILEQSNSVPANAQVTTAVATENPEAKNLVEEINKLKEELNAKAKQVEEMKTASAQNPAAAGPSLNAGEKDKLDLQIKELQAKLSEYEIISEDIADLSFYKEQNARLTKELENLKGGGAPVDTANEPAIVGKAKATQGMDSVVEQAAAMVASVTSTAAAAPVLEPEVALSTEASPVADVPAVAAAAPEVPAVENVVDDNLMAEFDAAVQSQQGSETSDEGANLGDMDMEKMMAEAANITTNVPEITAEEALGTGLDENKILLEAAAIEKVSPEDKKLMGDFENFVKKGS